MERDERDGYMIVVSDTTPLISLMKIGQLGLVEQLFGEVQIPDAVYTELITNPQFLEEAEQIQNSSFIKRIVIDDSKSVDLLCRATGLDKGESESIILSDICHADLLLMDEIKGRQVAKQMGLHLMGTVGMLRVAYEEKLLSYEDIIKCIEVLRENGRHISDRLFRQLLESIQS